MNLRTLRLYSGPGLVNKSLVKVYEEQFVEALQQVLAENPGLTLNAAISKAVTAAMTDLGEPLPQAVSVMEVFSE